MLANLDKTLLFMFLLDVTKIMNCLCIGVLNPTTRVGNSFVSHGTVGLLCKLFRGGIGKIIF